MNVDDWTGEHGEPLPMLYSKTSKGAINIWLCGHDGNTVWVEWGQKGGAQQKSSFKCEPKNEGKANATEGWQQAIKEAIALWKKKVKKKYHWDEDHWENNTNLKPMLAKVFAKEKHKLTYPVTVQTKLDGVRCFAYKNEEGVVVLQSRGGDPYTVHHIQEELQGMVPAGIVLDGEIYKHGVSLQKINSWVKRPQEDSAKLNYVLYDHVARENPEVDWMTREMHLKSFFVRNPQRKSVIPVTSCQVFDEASVQHAHNDYVSQGYEGAIVRSASGIYRFGYRSSDLLKLKNFEDDEFEIVDCDQGKGKFLYVPIFKCVTADGKTFDVVPKGTAEERKAMLEDGLQGKHNGKMLTVRYFNYTPDGIPFQVVGVAVRDPGT